MAFRIMMGLDSIGKPVKYDKMFTADDLKNSSVRTLVWIAKINENTEPMKRARRLVKPAIVMSMITL
ncbi:MAG: hypothetical protein ACLUKN_16455 [Bacilli bacterium]